MTTSYTPAQPDSRLLLVTHDAVLFVDATAADVVADLWSALGGAAPVQASLDILTRNGLGSAPSFALGQIVGGSLHALVRGPIALEASAASGTETIDGTGVSTWRETTIAGVTALRFGAGAADLPIGSGVVWASSFAFQPGTAPIAPVDPLREPVAAPVAAPAPAAPTPVFSTAPAPTPPVAAPPASAAPNPITVEPEEESLPAEHTMVEHTLADDLSDATVHRSRETGSAPELVGEHDGETVMSADIAALRARRAAPATPPTAVASGSAYLELPNNQREPLTQPVIIGRSPSVSQVSGAELPRLVSIPGNQDISRSHARFALEGDTVVVTDLHSRNGTTIALPGKPPQLLRKGEPTSVLPGTVVDLGGVLTLTVREG